MGIEGTNGKPRFMGGRRVPEWTEDPKVRTRARTLLAEGSSVKKLAESLNSEFKLKINGNSLGGFAHANKGNLDARAWLMHFLATLDSDVVTDTATAAPTRKPAGGVFIPASSVSEFYTDDRNPPGNRPLRVKKAPSNGSGKRRRKTNGAGHGIGRFTDETAFKDPESELFDTPAVFEDDDTDVIRSRMNSAQIREQAAKFLAFRKAQRATGDKN